MWSAKRVLCAAGVIASLSSVWAAECSGHPDPNAKPNMNAVWTGEPTLVREVKNAKMYVVGPPDDAVKIVHLWGTPYEMGVAQATIANESVTGLLTKVWEYLELQIEQAINGTVHNLKPAFVDLIAQYGLQEALQLEVDATQQFTGPYFNEELHGIADTTGIPFSKIQHIHLIGELTKGSCSMYGAWGKATGGTGKLMQLRALDWDVDGPFQDYPQLTVYHPNPGNGHAFANVAWSGFIGSITGMSSQQMAISEIGVSFPDSTFGKESRFGIPFTYILRDIIQFDTSLAEAEKRLTDAHRTCDLIFGVGDGKAGGGFRSVQYSHSVANFFNDSNMMPVADWHPRMEDVVYYGMDWLCPGYTSVLHAQLQKHYGNIDAETTISDITSIVQTGDLHVAIYDLTDSVMHLANARRDGAPGPAFAYDRTFLRLDMKAIFAESAPTVV